MNEPAMINRAGQASGRVRIVLVTADDAFEQQVRATLGAHAQIELEVLPGDTGQDIAAVDGAAVIVVDIGAGREEDVTRLHRVAMRFGARPPVVVVTQAFNEEIARRLLQIRIADFLVKPVAPVDLVRACARVAQDETGVEMSEARISTFLPAAGGVGVTTLAIQAAVLFLGGGRSKSSTCLVDLDFQHGACADYLDLEPRLDLGEIEPRPERLDRQLLEVMLSHHASGLAVVAAPSRPAEMRSLNPEVVTRLLDLVSARFEHVVIDMPRTWFPWTDSVLTGSNDLYVVTEATVPGLRHAKRLVGAIAARLGETVRPRVLVNRFEQRLFGPGLRRADIKQALGDTFAGTIPNNYRLVREAIDRGVPLDEVKAGNNVVAELRKAIIPSGAARPRARRDPARARGILWARRGGIAQPM